MSKKAAKKAVAKTASKKRKPRKKKAVATEPASEKSTTSQASTATAPCDGSEVAAVAESPGSAEFVPDVPIEDVGFGAALHDLEIEQVTAVARAPRRREAAVAVKATATAAAPEVSAGHANQTEALMARMLGDSADGYGGPAIQGATAEAAASPVAAGVPEPETADAAMATSPDGPCERSVVDAAPATAAQRHDDKGLARFVAVFFAGVVVGVLTARLF